MPRVHDSSNDEIEGNKDQFLVVGVGASAGGLDAFRKFFDVMPADSGMAFILVQHLDPSQESMIAELLSSHTKMKVYQAVEGTPVDFLLRSLAEQVGERAVGVVLSGTRSDGSVGLRAIKKSRGFIIAQEPSDAGFSGMPRSAIETGLVDRVLPVAKFPDALISYRRWMWRETKLLRDDISIPGDDPDFLTRIVELIRTNSAYDFTPYKRGTLERRTKRRMAMLEIEPEDMEQYLELLKEDPDEINTLAKDLLINVTNFFRDANVFNLLTDKIVPEMIENAKLSVPLRIWCVGCSSGEEVYSLVITFLEQIAKSKRPIKLQVFASDIDPNAIQTAREGLYPKTIAADVSPARLARFFTADRTGFRVSQKCLTSAPMGHIEVIA